jgi:hypothetical protein
MNDSKKQDERFWDKWRANGSVDKLENKLYTLDYTLQSEYYGGTLTKIKRMAKEIEADLKKGNRVTVYVEPTILPERTEGTAMGSDVSNIIYSILDKKNRNLEVIYNGKPGTGIWHNLMQRKFDNVDKKKFRLLEEGEIIGSYEAKKLMSKAYETLLIKPLSPEQAKLLDEALKARMEQYK